MNRPWIFLINPFISATDTSHRKMKMIGDYSLSALAAAAAKPGVPPVFNELVTELAPLVEKYNTAYNTRLSLQGVQKGQTQSLNDLLDNLASGIIQGWDLAVQNVYRQGTTQYMALLPRRRQPFQNGSQQDRIAAVGALLLTIGNDEALQALKTEVSNTYDALVQANFTQKGSKGNKNGSSDQLEAGRIALGNGLYGVLGALINLYKETPDVIASYFLLEELRNREQTSFQQDVNSGETVLVFTKTLEDSDQIKFTTGNASLQVALVPNKRTAMPQNAFALPANAEETLSPEALGIKGNRFLIVKNTSGTEKTAIRGVNEIQTQQWIQIDAKK